jgi:hypothetical protein
MNNKPRTINLICVFCQPAILQVWVTKLPGRRVAGIHSPQGARNDCREYASPAGKIRVHPCPSVVTILCVLCLPPQILFGEKCGGGKKRRNSLSEKYLVSLWLISGFIFGRKMRLFFEKFQKNSTNLRSFVASFNVTVRFRQALFPVEWADVAAGEVGEA